MKKERKGDDAFQNVTKANETESKKCKKKTRFWKYKRRRKKQETRLSIFKMEQMQIKKEAKKER